jgi:hypothetical protein
MLELFHETIKFFFLEKKTKKNSSFLCPIFITENMLKLNDLQCIFA